MKFHNYMEDVVFDALEKVLLGRDDICKCERCKWDLVALTLNKLPSKYVVTQKGSVYTRLAELELQFKVDIVRELAVAMEIVRDKPNH